MAVGYQEGPPVQAFDVTSIGEGLQEITLKQGYSFNPNIVITSGTNWIKFADGTMECWGRTARLTTSNVRTPLYQSPLSSALAFPVGVSFVGEYQLLHSAIESSTDWCWSTCTSAGGHFFTLFSMNPTASAVISWHAIGRWK